MRSEPACEDASHYMNSETLYKAGKTLASQHANVAVKHSKTMVSKPVLAMKAGAKSCWKISICILYEGTECKRFTHHHCIIVSKPHYFVNPKRST